VTPFREWYSQYETTAPSYGEWLRARDADEGHQRLPGCVRALADAARNLDAVVNAVKEGE
jgi:hypothetical protein